MRTISLSKLLGRQGMIKNTFLLRTKNYLRDDDEFTGGCVCTDMERYYNMDDRDNKILINRTRYREIKV